MFLLALMDVYLRKGLIHDALRFADRAIALDPLHIWAHAWKIYALGVLGDFDKAIHQVEIALDINPDEIILLVNLVSFYSFMSEFQKALKTYERIESINPKYIQNEYHQLKLKLLKGDSQIDLSNKPSPTAAILPTGNLELDFLTGELDQFESKFISWWEEYKSGENEFIENRLFI